MVNGIKCFFRSINRTLTAFALTAFVKALSMLRSGVGGGGGLAYETDGDARRLA